MSDEAFEALVLLFGGGTKGWFGVLSLLNDSEYHAYVMYVTSRPDYATTHDDRKKKVREILGRREEL